MITDEEPNNYNEDKKRQAVAFALFAAAVTAYFIADFSAPQETSLVYKTTPPTAQAAHKKPKGAAAVENFDGKLKNPFTDSHETRDGEERATAAKDAPPAIAPLPTAAKSKQNAPKLQGIASEGGNFLAFLSDGQNSQAVAQGEIFSGCRATRITADSVTLTDGTSEVTLYLDKQ